MLPTATSQCHIHLPLSGTTVSLVMVGWDGEPEATERTGGALTAAGFGMSAAGEAALPIKSIYL